MTGEMRKIRMIETVETQLDAKVGNLLLTDKVRELRKGTFGVSIIYDHVDCDSVLLCRNSGYGLIPMCILLPHQIYLKTIEKVIHDHPDTREITLIPIKSSEHIMLASK